MTVLENGIVVVTGGAGLIGSTCVWALNQRGIDRVVVCDQLGRDEKYKNLLPLRIRDLIPAQDLMAWLTRRTDVACILHLGACSATTETDVDFLMRNNYGFTRDLAAHCLGRGIRFVYASSAATYGAGDSGMSDGDESLDRLRPLNPYGWSKQLFDQHAKREGFQDRIVGLKYFNVFGPNEDHKGDMRSVVHKSFEQIQKDGVVRLFKSYHPDYRDGCQMRDFLYVKDAVDMTLYLAGEPHAGGLFNIGSGVASTWLELVEAVFRALGKSPNVEFIDMPATLRAKYQYFTRAEIGKLRAVGYSKPVTPLAQAVRDYVVGYLAPGKRLGDGLLEPRRD